MCAAATLACVPRTVIHRCPIALADDALPFTEMLDRSVTADVKKQVSGSIDADTNVRSQI